MAKKKIQDKRRHHNNQKESHKRKILAEQELSDIGLRLDDDLQIIGIIFNDLTISHLTYGCINSINKMCKQFVGLDWHIFVECPSRPCIKPDCAVGEIKDVLCWRDPLIATNLNTCIYALNSSSKHIYYYAFDIEFMNEYELSWDVITKCFNDPRITVVVRCMDHKRLIEDEFDISVSDVIVEEFDLVLLSNLIIKDVKNVSKMFPN